MFRSFDVWWCVGISIAMAISALIFFIAQWLLKY
jgi:hypothetical protein